MRIEIVLGAAHGPMQLRLEEALRRDYDQIFITGTSDEMHCLDDQLQDTNVAHYEAYSTFGNYVAVCDNTQPEDELTFIGHESHTHRMEVYRKHFSNRNIDNVVLPDTNLKPAYRAFDRVRRKVISWFS